MVPATADPPRPAAFPRTAALLLGVILLAWVSLTTAKLLSNRYTLFDQGLFHSWLVSAARGDDVLSPYEGGVHHFNIHFSPLIYVLVPLYLPRGEDTPLFVLVIVKLALYAVSTLLVFRIARSRLPRGAAAWLTVFFVSCPIVFHNVLADIHDIDLALPLLFGAWHLRGRGRAVPSMILAGVASLAKEELWLVASFFALLLFLDTRKGKWLVVAGLLLATFVIVVRLVMPAFPPGGSSLSRDIFREVGHSLRAISAGDDVGANALSLLRGLLFPMFWKRKLASLVVLVLPFLGLFLRAPRCLVPVIPTLVYLWIAGERGVAFDFRYHYVLVLLPFMVGGSVEALAALRRRGRLILGMTILGSVLSVVVLPLIAWKHLGPIENDSVARELAAEIWRASPRGTISADNLTWRHFPIDARMRSFNAEAAGGTSLLNADYAYLALSAVPGGADVVAAVTGEARFHLLTKGILVLSDDSRLAKRVGLREGPPTSDELAAIQWEPPVPDFVRAGRHLLRGDRGDGR